MKDLHISQVRRMLAEHKPMTISYVTSKGELQTVENAIPLAANFYAGFRNVKLPNGQIRKVRENLIVAVNSCEVYI